MAAAAPALQATFFPASAWITWTAVGLAVYMAYWAGLNKTMPP